MGISVCMIVRNEERLLPRCLESLRGGFDEFNIVDTGSKDSTISIAKQFGARVRSFTACNGEDGLIRDFAMARNASLDMASHEWILWMDADDVLQPGGAERFRAAAARGGFAALCVTLDLHPFVTLQQRLFKNGPCTRFIGRIHEYIPVDGPIDEDPAIVVCHSCQAEPGQPSNDECRKEPSLERNVRIGEKVAIEEPTNHRNLFLLASALLSLRRFDEAIVRFSQVLALRGAYEDGSAYYEYESTYRIAFSLYFQGRWGECIAMAGRALEMGPRYAEPRCLIADCYRKMGLLDRAVEWYESAIACAPPTLGAIGIEPRKYGEYPRLGITTCEHMRVTAQASAGLRCSSGQTSSR